MKWKVKENDNLFIRLFHNSAHTRQQLNAEQTSIVTNKILVYMILAILFCRSYLKEQKQAARKLL